MSLTIHEKEAFKVNGEPVDLNFCLEGGSINLLTGPNGCGKSTLMDHLKKRPALLDGLAPSFMDQEALRPLTDMRGAQVLKVATEEVPGAVDWRGNPLLAGLKIGSLLEKPVSALSGGENQKLKLALAMTRPFDILLADEPLQFLDDKNKKAFLELFLELARKGKILFLAEHARDAYENARLIEFKKGANRVEVTDA